TASVAADVCRNSRRVAMGILLRGGSLLSIRIARNRFQAGKRASAAAYRRDQAADDTGERGSAPAPFSKRSGLRGRAPRLARRDETWHRGYERRRTCRLGARIQDPAFRPAVGRRPTAHDSVSATVTA